MSSSAGAIRAFGQVLDKNVNKIPSISSNSLLKQANAVNGKVAVVPPPNRKNGDAGGTVTNMDITLDGEVARQAAQAHPLSVDNTSMYRDPNLANAVQAQHRVQQGFTCDKIAATREDCQLYSVPYVQRIMDRNFQMENENRPDPNYMAGVQQTSEISSANQIHYKMRTILLNWNVEVHLKFRLRQPTLHLSVNIMDRFLVTGVCILKTYAEGVMYISVPPK